MVNKSRISSSSKRMVNEIRLNSRVDDMSISLINTILVLDYIVNGPYESTQDTIDNVERLSESIFRSNVKLN